MKTSKVCLIIIIIQPMSRSLTMNLFNNNQNAKCKVPTIVGKMKFSIGFQQATLLFSCFCYFNRSFYFRVWILYELYLAFNNEHADIQSFGKF